MPKRGGGIVYARQGACIDPQTVCIHRDSNESVAALLAAAQSDYPPASQLAFDMLKVSYCANHSRKRFLSVTARLYRWSMLDFNVDDVAIGYT